MIWRCRISVITVAAGQAEGGQAVLISRDLGIRFCTTGTQGTQYFQSSSESSCWSIQQGADIAWSYRRMLSISRPLQSILILIFTELLFNIKGKIRFPRQPKPQVPTEYPQDVWVAFQSQSLKSGNAIYYVLKLWSGICQLILMEDLCCSELWTSERQSQSFLFLSQEQCIQTSQLSAFVAASSLIFWSGVSGPLQKKCCFMRGARNVSLCWVIWRPWFTTF